MRSLVLTGNLDQQLAGLNFAAHLELELIGEMAAFESQGIASFQVLRELNSLSQLRGVLQDITMKIQGGRFRFLSMNRASPNRFLPPGCPTARWRYLCLLALLCHPTPPPLLCLEEPELGLHPDLLTTVAELLVEASQRTQLVVTTHSDALVSALTDAPESVLVVEHDLTGTQLRRLEATRLKRWLEKYSLGELWRMGEIGGTRW